MSCGYNYIDMVRLRCPVAFIGSLGGEFSQWVFEDGSARVNQQLNSCGIRLHEGIIGKIAFGNHPHSNGK